MKLKWRLRIGSRVERRHWSLKEVDGRKYIVRKGNKLGMEVLSVDRNLDIWRPVVRAVDDEFFSETYSYRFITPLCALDPKGYIEVVAPADMRFNASRLEAETARKIARAKWSDDVKIAGDSFYTAKTTECTPEQVVRASLWTGPSVHVPDTTDPPTTPLFIVVD